MCLLFYVVVFLDVFIFCYFTYCHLFVIVLNCCFRNTQSQRRRLSIISYSTELWFDVLTLSKGPFEGVAISMCHQHGLQELVFLLLLRLWDLIGEVLWLWFLLFFLCGLSSASLSRKCWIILLIRSPCISCILL